MYSQRGRLVQFICMVAFKYSQAHTHTHTQFPLHGVQKHTYIAELV